MKPMARLLTQFFIMAYLAVQLLVPLRGLVQDKFETRGNFSWNMYSRRYSCGTAYTLHADGVVRSIDLALYLRGQTPKAFHRDTLPRFHAWLCDELDAQRGTRLIGAVAFCRIDDGPRVDLVRPGIDICVADDYGVE